MFLHYSYHYLKLKTQIVWKMNKRFFTIIIHLTYVLLLHLFSLASMLMTTLTLGAMLGAGTWVKVFNQWERSIASETEQVSVLCSVAGYLSWCCHWSAADTGTGTPLPLPPLVPTTIGSCTHPLKYSFLSWRKSLLLCEMRLFCRH